jgi:hypothetical protein
MFRRIAGVATSWRKLSFSQPIDYFKRNNHGQPLNQISEWIDEGIDIGFLDARTTIRSQQFKKQTRKNVRNRKNLTIVRFFQKGILSR